MSGVARERNFNITPNQDRPILDNCRKITNDLTKNDYLFKWLDYYN